MAARTVTITLTKKVVAQYEARSFPDDDLNNDGLWELYKVPVHEILIEGTDNTGQAVKHVHQGPRFMPYFNPGGKDRRFSHKGWANSGLSSKRTIKVRRYKKDYEISNRYSPGRGAIVLKGAFYIHAGPADLSDIGFGSAGCVEIIGDYDVFKKHIADLSGTNAKNSDDAIAQLVTARKLVVKIEGTTAPNIKKLRTRQISPIGSKAPAAPPAPRTPRRPYRAPVPTGGPGGPLGPPH